MTYSLAIISQLGRLRFRKGTRWETAAASPSPCPAVSAAGEPMGDTHGDT